MKQYRMEQLQNGCWCVWRSGGAVNAAVPTMVEAERLVNVLKSRTEEEFDLSDLSIKPKEKTREDIIAEAEAAAFAES